MSVPLLDAAKLASHALTFSATARRLGFQSVGEIDRFIFHDYAKALKSIPWGGRPKGAIFFLDPSPSTPPPKSPPSLRATILEIQKEVATHFYQVDLAGNTSAAFQTSAEDVKRMALDVWPLGHAQFLSRSTGRCVVWANGVNVVVHLAGDVYLESPSVIDEIKTGIPTTFQSLPWDEGEIVYEFAESELKDTTDAGIWRLPEKLLLKPKPEKMMSLALGRFLKHRMAGYRHHDDEPYVENEGRADISLMLYNGFVYIVEVKWVGRSLVATKALENDKAVKDALKAGSSGWQTLYDDKTFEEGAKQLAKYFKTGKYARAYLAVFDCCAPKPGKKHEVIPVTAAHVAPHDCTKFRALRACVDPRKASKSSKAKL